MLAIFPLDKVFRIFLGQGRFAEQRFVTRFVATGKDAIKRIVILGWNRIELVVVTARARHRQPHRAARYYIDPIINDVRLVVQKSPAQG